MRFLFTILILICYKITWCQDITYQKILNEYQYDPHCLVIGGTGYVTFSYYPTIGIHDGGVMRINQLGNIAGGSTYTDSTSDVVLTDMQLTSGNKILLSGNSDTKRLFILQTDTLGNIEWQRSFNHLNLDVTVHDLKETSSGDFLAVCSIDSNFVNFGYVIKFSKEGNCKWIKKINKNYDEFNSIEEISPNRFMLFGRSEFSILIAYQVWTVGLVSMMDSLGNILWSKNYGGLSFSRSSFIDSYLHSSNEVFLVGETTEFGFGKTDISFLKMDSLGNIKFCTLIGDSLDQHANSISFLFPDKLVITGGSLFNDSQSNGLLVIVDTLGNTLSSRVYQSGYSMNLSDLSVNPSGNGLFACGIRKSSAGSSPLIYVLNSNNFGYSHCSNINGKLKSQRIDSMFQLTHYESVSSMLSDTVVYPIYRVSKSSSFYSSCSSASCNVKANFSASKYRLCGSDSLFLKNYSINSSTYNWYVDGGNVSNLMEPVLTFSQSGSHTLMLVAQSSSCSDTASIEITVDSSPSADFNFEINSQQVQFSPSDSSSLTYHWNFGEGSVSSLPSPNHSFPLRQPYSVCLVATNSCGIDTQCILVDLSDTNYVSFFCEIQLLQGFIKNPTGFIQTFDGGYLLQGYYAPSSPQTILVRTDRNGQYEWGKISGTSSVLVGGGLVRSKDGGFFFFENGVGCHVDHYDETGVQNWGLSLAGAYFNDVYEFDDGSYLFFGTYQDSISLIKTDHFARRLWQYKYGGVGFLSSSIHTDDGFLMLGRYYSSNEPVVVKIDESGHLIWEKKYTGYTQLFPWQMSKTADGGFLIAVNYQIDPLFHPLIVFKIDSVGNILWKTKLFRVGETEECVAIFEQLNGSDFYIVRKNEVLKFDSIGNLLWNYIYLGEVAKAYPTFDGGLAVAGHYSGFSILKIDKNGNAGCVKSNIPFDIQSASSLNKINVNYSYQFNLENLYGYGPDFTPLTCTDVVSCFATTQCSTTADFSYQTILNETQFSDSSLNATEWEWQFGDGQTSLQQNPSHVFDSSGVYNVCLIAKGTCGVDTICKPVVISCSTEANFSFTVTDNLVQFTNSSYNSNSWYWDFGDGTTSSLENPSHLYVGSGTYHVCLTATGVCSTDSICVTLSVIAVGASDLLVSPCVVYPNPTTGILTIDCQNYLPNQTRVCILTDLTGRNLFQSENLELVNKIDLTNFDPGIYLLYFIDKNTGHISIQKIVKLE